jgi:hypothetical protein
VLGGSRLGHASVRIPELNIEANEVQRAKRGERNFEGSVQGIFLREGHMACHLIQEMLEAYRKYFFTKQIQLMQVLGR